MGVAKAISGLTSGLNSDGFQTDQSELEPIKQAEPVPEQLGPRRFGMRAPLASPRW